MSTLRTIAVATAGLGTIVLVVATPILDTSPTSDRVPLAGSSAGAVGADKHRGTLLRPNDVEARRVLARTGR